MSIFKKYQFWICAVFAVVFFAVIYPLSVSPYTAAYYVLVFNAISIIGFTTVQRLQTIGAGLGMLLGIVVSTVLDYKTKEQYRAILFSKS